MERFLKGENGQGLVEYALIISVVSVVLVASLVLFSDQLAVSFNTIANALQSL
ncbi:MAG: Flp family type IVb pilin [Candidatus Omnitrophica bacterium]|nr:Flp family type IVb pilin [Candidatus Omnitrophota bacterium]